MAMEAAFLKTYPELPLILVGLHESTLDCKLVGIRTKKSRKADSCLNLAVKKGETGGSVRWVSADYVRIGERRKVATRSTSGSWENNPCSAAEVGGLVEEHMDVRSRNGEKGQMGFLVSEHGWCVRRMVEKEEEMRQVAHVQAEAFHVPQALFNDLFFQFFQAEVLSALIYKIRNSPPNRYSCLVAEPVYPPDSSDTSKGLVGVVDVTVQRDSSILKHLNGAEEYIFVSGIAVMKDFRRRKIATALLKACDVLSFLWGYDHLALRAYEDDLAACKLYLNAGYKVVARDPFWMTTGIGRRRRVLMTKQTVLCM